VKSGAIPPTAGISASVRFRSKPFPKIAATSFRRCTSCSEKDRAEEDRTDHDFANPQWDRDVGFVSGLTKRL